MFHKNNEYFLIIVEADEHQSRREQARDILHQWQSSIASDSKYYSIETNTNAFNRRTVFPDSVTLGSGDVFARRSIIEDGVRLFDDTNFAESVTLTQRLRNGGAVFESFLDNVDSDQDEPEPTLVDDDKDGVNKTTKISTKDKKIKIGIAPKDFLKSSDAQSHGNRTDERMFSSLLTVTSSSSSSSSSQPTDTVAQDDDSEAIHFVAGERLATCRREYRDALTRHSHAVNTLERVTRLVAALDALLDAERLRCATTFDKSPPQKNRDGDEKIAHKSPSQRNCGSDEKFAAGLTTGGGSTAGDNDARRLLRRLAAMFVECEGVLSDTREATEGLRRVADEVGERTRGISAACDRLDAFERQWTRAVKKYSADVENFMNADRRRLLDATQVF